MAKDFIQLKRSLISDRRAFIMGGSHGAMLGAQIVSDYPEDVEKAVLFSGDTESGWLDDGWFRFDRLMAKLDATHPGFIAALKRLLESAEAGKLLFTKDGKEVAVDRATFENGLWLLFSLDSAKQAALPGLVKAADEQGERRWIATVHAAALTLFAPPAGPSQPPTESSLVTNFHRCNVWFPKSWRAKATPRQGTVFRHDVFIRYWNTLCERYDTLGEFPQHAATATSVPILTWVGDQDTFDPTVTQEHWAGLSSQLTFQVMQGWSHDFGPTLNTGIARVAQLVKAFLAPP
jgi:pimeloyl-ACP methyl ester carboxylesterase